MEEHRLKPMKEGYDQKLFNCIYKETAGLRKKLAFEIDARRFSVDYNEVLSWFDVKFIFVFNQYYGTIPDERLKGYIIRALQMFKFRILRVSYNQKSSIYNKTDIVDISQVENIVYEDETSEELFLKIALDFLKKELSKDAYFLLELLLNPPHYILNRLSENNKIDLNKIPNTLLLEYLDLEETSISYIDNLKKEIRKATRSCKDYFLNSKLIIN